MHPYVRYLLGRLATYAGVVFFAILINFIIPRMIPGDPIKMILGKLLLQGTKVGGEELVEAYKRMFGLEGDIWTQFVCYLRELLRGNLGYSIANFPATVMELIHMALPWTIGLLSVTVVLAWIIGSILGALAGWKGAESKVWGYVAPFALVFSIIPYYMFAVILVFLLAYLIPIFPMSGAYSIGMIPSLSWSFIVDVIRHSILPALSILITSLGWWFLSMRSLIIMIKGEDYILMAEAKGLKEKTILWSYAFRNAMLPQTTGLTLALGNIVGGALLTEIVFAYPGMGWLLYNAITSLDYPVIQGVVLIIILAVCTATFIIDMIYPFIDPRIRYGAE
ncbi:MAG: ABC transporter permease [Thermoprotei archaeon]|nr:MAG: ABC transporter permease [Thermoprotei archaeon]RLF25523.1 MAG: ABC transporter permease [Thermoprotei archaeon]